MHELLVTFDCSASINDLRFLVTHHELLDDLGVMTGVGTSRQPVA